jgi:hypothetical protein
MGNLPSGAGSATPLDSKTVQRPRRDWEVATVGQAAFPSCTDVLTRRGAILLLASGQELCNTEEASIRRNLARSLAHGRGPGAVARLLTTLVRIVASRNTRVGRSMLINVLPIGAVGKHGASGVPIPEDFPFSHLSSRTEEATFLYVAADRSSPRSYGPSAVFEQVSFKDVEFSTDPSDYPLGRPVR